MVARETIGRGNRKCVELSRYYHVISYSRRYNFPNVNPQTANDHSVNTEAADLAALIKALRLKHVNLVGMSTGGGDSAGIRHRTPWARCEVW